MEILGVDIFGWADSRLVDTAGHDDFVGAGRHMCRHRNVLSSTSAWKIQNTERYWKIKKGSPVKGAELVNYLPHVI